LVGVPSTKCVATEFGSSNSLFSFFSNSLFSLSLTHPTPYLAHHHWVGVCVWRQQVPPPPGTWRPSSGPKWAKRADHGGPNRGGGGPLYQGKRSQNFSRPNFPTDPGAQNPIGGGGSRDKTGFCVTVVGF